MKTMYNGEPVEVEEREDGAYVYDEAVCDYVRIGSVEQVEAEQTNYYQFN